MKTKLTLLLLLVLCAVLIMRPAKPDALYAEMLWQKYLKPQCDRHINAYAEVCEKIAAEEIHGYLMARSQKETEQ